MDFKKMSLNKSTYELVNSKITLYFCTVGLLFTCLLSTINALVEIKEIESGLHYIYDDLAKKNLSELSILKLTKHKVCLKNSLSSEKSKLYLEYVKIAFIVTFLVLIRLRRTKN